MGPSFTLLVSLWAHFSLFLWFHFGGTFENPNCTPLPSFTVIPPPRGFKGILKIELFTFLKLWNEVDSVTQWYHNFSSRISKLLYYMYLYHSLWFTNQLFQLVNIQMTDSYCRVIMKHVGHSYGQAMISGLWYIIFTNDIVPVFFNYMN